MWLCTHITFIITTQQPCLSFYSKILAQFAIGLGDWMNMHTYIEATNYLKTYILQGLLNQGVLWPVLATLLDHNFIESCLQARS